MTPSPTPWRLILHAHALPGPWNMAVDEAILETAGRGEVLPTLRLYAWNPPCLSLGFAQPVSDVEREGLARRGWDLVRRPTGGRAILHTDELTYSVCGPASEPVLAGSVLESYQRLSVALLAALQALGLPVAASPTALVSQGSDPKGAVCFEVPSNYEITAGGKKLIGSAQARRRECVLQHGSLPLTGDLTRITQVLAFPDGPLRQQAAERLLVRATTVEASLGKPVSWEQAAQAFAAAFAAQLNLELQAAPLTAAEEARARVLLAEKYAAASWTDRV